MGPGKTSFASTSRSLAWIRVDSRFVLFVALPRPYPAASFEQMLAARRSPHQISITQN